MSTSAQAKVFVIGVGDDGLAGLNQQARDILRSADLIFGSEKTLEHLESLDCAKLPLESDLVQVATTIKNDLPHRRMVVVAGGDPLFYGVARYLLHKVGNEHFEVIPHVSSMQLAFARVKQSWEEAYLTSLSGRDPDEVVDRIRICEKAGIFTTEAWPPNRVCTELLAFGIDYFEAYVCENLGMPNERVTRGTLQELSEMEFAALNVLILVRQPDRPDRVKDAQGLSIFGNPDECFLQNRPRSDLITHAEVRAVALARMNIHPTSIVWDVGAGCGSLAIEAAQLAQRGNVYAIEKDARDFELLQKNQERFGVTNLHAIHGAAPAAFEPLPDPISVFIGATGRELGQILTATHQRLQQGGRLVVNVAALETLQHAWERLKQLEAEPSVQMMQISRGTHQLDTVRFEALNPSFLLAIEKHG